ncbi:cytidylyltransferase domain-containing protein [Planctomicrobium sp. SH668]|uniref:acylneuraminate cytidylyltransferase family protein n=1 Tax=Planctomicrobium sp. SH668 TaxID=3448126 RepID=UPI003F5B6EDE
MASDPKLIAMIPARLGSKRLKQKNLREIQGRSLVEFAVERAIHSGVFAEVWVNSESDVFAPSAEKHGAKFHQRPEELSRDDVTSEDFVMEFINKHECDYVVQVHSITPLLQSSEIREFAAVLKAGKYNTLLSHITTPLQSSMNDQPVNFSYELMPMTQNISPIQIITWSITGWNAAAYRERYESKNCATFTAPIGYFEVKKSSGLVVKTEEDFQLIEAIAPTVNVFN